MIGCPPHPHHDGHLIFSEILLQNLLFSSVIGGEHDFLSV